MKGYPPLPKTANLALQRIGLERSPTAGAIYAEQPSHVEAHRRRNKAMHFHRYLLQHLQRITSNEGFEAGFEGDSGHDGDQEASVPQIVVSSGAQVYSGGEGTGVASFETGIFIRHCNCFIS